MTGDFQQLGMANVASRLREVEVGVASIAGDVPMIMEGMTRLDADVTRLIDGRRRILETLSSHEDTLRELTATVKRLSLQVAWIEQHLRSSGSARTVDLDHADPELVALAAGAEAGRAVASVLLGESERDRLLHDVAHHREVVAERDEAMGHVIEGSGRLMAADPRGAAYRKDRAEYVAARARFDEVGARVVATERSARAAQARLDADEVERRRTGPVVADGARAERELLTRLRTRVVAAVGDGAMLPAWLTGPLGPMPAAGAAQRWTDVAAGLLAYRVTYGVTDPADAIGELPHDAGERRRRWHADLGRGVRELRRP